MAQGEPGKMEEAVSVMRDLIPKEVPKIAGLNGVLFRVDRKSGKVMTVSLWESEAHRAAPEAERRFQELLTQFKSLGARPDSIVRQGYEVAAMTLPK